MIDVQNGQQMMNAPIIQVICLIIADYHAMFAKMRPLMTYWYHYVMTIMIDVKNGQQTTNAQEIRTICDKIVKHPAVCARTPTIRNART